MAAGQARSLSSTDRLAGAWDSLKASFGFLSGVAMLAGVLVGFGLPALDDWLEVDLPVFAFDTQEAATSVLETIATVTVAVAGLSFSVTVVAFTLASSQLSPRVLRSFRGDRLSQATLAVFLGTFIYCLVVLVRLGIRENANQVPDLSITLAVILALVAFGLFAGFIAHIVNMLQPGSVIATIGDDAHHLLENRFPSGVGEGPGDARQAETRLRARTERSQPEPVRTDRHGYVTLVRADALMSTTGDHDALVRQRVAIGDYVVPGEVIAEVWAREPDEKLLEAVERCFEIGRQRTLVQDVAFPIRQLADVALKGLSPGINDPTTAENAMEELTAVLVRFVQAGAPDPVRVDSDGEPRLVALVPTLDDLVRLGFNQVRVFAAPYPVVTMRLLQLLDSLAAAARRCGVAHGEIDRQMQRLRESPDGEVPTAGDTRDVERAYARTRSEAAGARRIARSSSEKELP